MPSSDREKDMTRNQSRTATPANDECRPAPFSALYTHEHALLAALVQHPGSSSAELAELAGVGGSTARRLLAAAQQKGMVDRLPGHRFGGRRNPDRWSLLDPTATSACERDEALTEPQADEVPERSRLEAVPAPESSATRERLGKGALRGLVEDFLREHPGQEFGPTALAKALHRSAGAINNACEKLVAEGYVHRARQAPKRFTLASDESGA